MHRRRRLRHRDAVPGHGRPAAGRRRRAGHRSAGCRNHSIRCRGSSRSARCAGSAASRTRSTCGTGRCSSSRRPPSAQRCQGRSGWGSSALTFVLAEASRRWIEDPIRHGRCCEAPAVEIAGGRRSSPACWSRGVARGRRRGPTGDGRSAEHRRRRGRADDAEPDAGDARAATPAPTERPREQPAGRADARARRPAGPVPADLVPPLATVRDDIPVIYADACHAEWRETSPPDCVYGGRMGRARSCLIGDSHAAHWFPTLQRLADEQDWRLISLDEIRLPGRRPARLQRGTQARVRRVRRVAGRGPRSHQRARSPAMVVISDSRTGQLWVDGCRGPIDRPGGPVGDRTRAVHPGHRARSPTTSSSSATRPGRRETRPSVSRTTWTMRSRARRPLSKALGLERAATEKAVSGRDGRDVHRSRAVALPDGAVPGGHRARARVPRRPPHDHAVRPRPGALPRAAAAQPARLMRDA